MSVSERLGTVTNIAVLCLVAFALGRPSGPVGALVVDRWRTVSRNRILEREWTRVSDGARLDASRRPAVMVEFSDYECPFCREQHKSLSATIDNGVIGGVVFRHLPLVIHTRARGAALAVICAEAQGKFRELHNRLFSDAAWLADTNWVREARAVGIEDSVAFVNCTRGKAARDRLERDMSMARELGLRGTPSFLFRSKFVEGVLAESTMVRLAGSH